MKKLKSLFALILTVVSGCNTQLEKIEITPDITFSISTKYKLIVEDSVNYLKTWQTSIDDDHFAIFRYSIKQPDSLSISAERQILKNNVDNFVRTFDFKNVDSTFTYKDKLVQADLFFDFVTNNDDYRFYGRFLVNKDYFIAICYQMPYPLDQSSKRIKDKLFASIETK
jgi:hypothetical protein